MLYGVFGIVIGLARFRLGEEILETRRGHRRGPILGPVEDILGGQRTVLPPQPGDGIKLRIRMIAAAR